MISKFSFFFGISTQTPAHGSVASSTLMMSDDSIIHLLTRNLWEFSLKRFNDRLVAKNSRWYLRRYWDNSRLWTTVLVFGSWWSDDHKFLLQAIVDCQRLFLLKSALIKQSLEVQLLKLVAPSWHLSPSPWFSHDARSLESYQIVSFQSLTAPNMDRVIV